MWVVKIGGSLGQDPLLPQWLTLLTQLGAGRVALVAGGGGFADEARRLHNLWHFGDVAAHNMAVLAMALIFGAAAALPGVTASGWTGPPNSTT
jgi:aspartokinase-like uncharacterized kinase